MLIEAEKEEKEEEDKEEVIEDMEIRGNSIWRRPRQYRVLRGLGSPQTPRVRRNLKTDNSQLRSRFGLFEKNVIVMKEILRVKGYRECVRVSAVLEIVKWFLSSQLKTNSNYAAVSQNHTPATSTKSPTKGSKPT